MWMKSCVECLQDRIDKIEAMDLSTEKEKLENCMRVYRPDLGLKGEVYWNDCAPQALFANLARREMSLV